MATKLSMKLLVDNKSQKVLFAEGGKDFIDFLFSFLVLPLGSVTEVLTKEGMVGALGELYKSMENMDETYIPPGQDKGTLLQPKIALPISKPLLLQIGNAPVERKYYTCSNNQHGYNIPCRYISDVVNSACPACRGQMSLELSNAGTEKEVAASRGGEGGFVKGVVTYMVMDDLLVTPMSAVSAITLLNKFNVKEFSSLEEMTVEVGRTEGAALLKASLQSKTVLTDVFLGRPTKGSQWESHVIDAE